MPDPITPALTPEEWAIARQGQWAERLTQAMANEVAVMLGKPADQADPRQVAALCLVGYLTRKDVDAIEFHDSSGALHGLAQRIAALLPPRVPREAIIQNVLHPSL
jgi:hypothetical protein